MNPLILISPALFLKSGIMIESEERGSIAVLLASIIVFCVGVGMDIVRCTENNNEN